jgi:hypothetical protein
MIDNTLAIIKQHFAIGENGSFDLQAATIVVRAAG